MEDEVGDTVEAEGDATLGMQPGNDEEIIQKPKATLENGKALSARSDTIEAEAAADIEDSDLVLHKHVGKQLEALDPATSVKPGPKSALVDQGRCCALEISRGLGRISLSLLTQYYTKVDLLTGPDRFYEAQAYGRDRMHNFHAPCDLSDFRAESRDDKILKNYKNKYDCIWIQWILQFMTFDADVVSCLRRCSQYLREPRSNVNSLMFIKESLATNQSITNEAKNTRIRTYAEFVEIFDN